MLRDLAELRRLQQTMAKQVLITDAFLKPIRSVAGIDLAFVQDTAIIACVIVDYDTLTVRSIRLLMAELDFPYVATFLSFREGPPIIRLINQVDPKPDIFFINAHGLAHPRLCGCASHVGLLARVPTIGVAAHTLCGRYEQEPTEMGKAEPLWYRRKTVGWVLKSKENCRPIFVSPGHLVSLQTSLDVSRKCIKNHKLPEPLYLAHRIANEEKRRRV